jgi:hypothetical protein
MEQRELDQLQRALARTQRQLAEKQAQLEQLRGRTGVGGSAVGGSGQEDLPVAVGTVRSISPNEINLRGEDGVIRSYPLDRKARAFRSGKRIPVAAIREGTQVRASLERVPGRPDVYWIDVVREPVRRMGRRAR